MGALAELSKLPTLQDPPGLYTDDSDSQEAWDAWRLELHRRLDQAFEIYCPHAGCAIHRQQLARTANVSDRAVTEWLCQRIDLGHYEHPWIGRALP